MSQPEKTTDAPQVLAAALPQSQVLGYFAALSSPTRVRRVAKLGTQLVAVLSLLISICAAIMAGQTISYAIETGASIVSAIRSAEISIAFAALFAGTGIGEWLLAVPVERGSKSACLAAMWMLLPAVVATMVAMTALFFEAAILFFNANGASNGTRWVLGIVCGILSLAFLITSALMSDLSKCLKWIAANPAVEKPPTPFLP